MGGLGHDFKVGANWIHEPHLFATFNGGATPQLTLNSDSLSSTVRQVLFNGGAADVNIPLDLYAFYVQDDWRVNDRLTFNLGLRYDYVDGVPIGQEPNANFRVMQAAGAGGTVHRLPAPRGLRTVVAERRRQLAAARRLRLRPARQRTRCHPRRLGPLHRLRVHQLERALPGHRRRRRTRTGLLRQQSCRHPQGGRILLHGRPIRSRRSPRRTKSIRRWPRSSARSRRRGSSSRTRGRPTSDGRTSSTRRRPSPWTTCASTAATSTSASGRTRASTAAPRRLADLAIRPNTLSFRTAVSKGESTYDGLIIGLRRRMSKGFDLSASYTLSDARSIIGTANDELDANNIQDATDPFADVNVGPSSRTDARHRVSISAVVQAPWGIQVAPFFLYRTGLPTPHLRGDRYQQRRQRERHHAARLPLHGAER